MVSPARSLLLLAALTFSLQPSAAIYFFSREEAPTPEPASAGPARCVCSVSDWCAPVLFPKVDRTEVFAFVLNTTAKTWQTFDWKKLTTIVLFNFMDPELVCLAHKHSVRVLENANFLKANVTNATYRAEWASLHVKYVEQHYLDGINVDFEEPVGDKEPARAAYVQLMNETRRQLNTYHQTAVLAVDVPWSPDCIDGRCYDFKGLYNFTDMLFIMGYDLRSTVYSKDCTAGANSPLNLTLAGVRKYMAMGMTASKLVLGVPWYGYDYACLNVTHNGTVCDIKRVHFFNASCSDAAGVERPFWKLDVWSQTALQNFWSNASQSPYFNIKFAGWNMTHQVWYDNVTSLTYKYMGAASLKLRGVGIWAANFLASGNSSWARAQRDSMWGALPLGNWQDDGQRLTARRPDAQRRLRYGTAAAADRHVELALLGGKWLGNEDGALAEQGGPPTIVARAPQPVVEA